MRGVWRNCEELRLRQARSFVNTAHAVADKLHNDINKQRIRQWCLEL